MNETAWYPIDDFHTRDEFDRFVKWIEDQVSSGTAESQPVRTPYAGAATLREKWFRNIETEEVWRLVWPDPPFSGLFKPI
jgi:hypothetical protein